MSVSMKRGKYTLEFKEESVRQVLAGASIGSVADSLGIPRASLGNWVRQQCRGQLGANNPNPSDTPVTAEQMELARLRAEVARLRMERDIAKKPRRTLRRTRCKVSLDSKNEVALAHSGNVQGAGCQRERLLRLAGRPR